VGLKPRREDEVRAGEKGGRGRRRGRKSGRSLDDAGLAPADGDGVEGARDLAPNARLGDSRSGGGTGSGCFAWTASGRFFTRRFPPGAGVGVV